MILKDLFNLQLPQLETLYPHNRAKKILQLLYEELLDVDNMHSTTTQGLTISKSNQNELEKGFQQLMDYFPVQYITGAAWFYGYKFRVSPAVLIPRPETEELVEKIIQEANACNYQTVLDIGTGSGCIPIMLKKKLPQTQILAIDVQPEALQIAHENALHLQTAVDFLCMDFLDENNWNQLGKYDIIVSNPPYIAQSQASLMDKEVVDFEPGVALFMPDESVFLFYEKIAAFGKHHLANAGVIFVEINQQFPEAMKRIFSNQGYEAVVLDDMSGNPRMLKATRFR